MAKDQDMGVIFPVAGMDASCEFGRQPVDTTPSGTNVRSQDAFLSRKRGGSRSGLSRYINEQVAGDFPIQHLAILVDPQAIALNSDTNTQVPGYIPDPSSNNLSFRVPTGRYVPPGGSGRQPNRNIPGGTLSPISFLSKYRDQPGVLSAEYNLVLPAQPENQSLILVFVRTQRSGPTEASVSLVTNDALNLYTQVGGPGSTAFVVSNLGGDVANSLSCWWKIASAGVSDQTIRITPASTGAIYEIVVLTYRSISSTSPVSAFKVASSAADTSSPSITGLLTNGSTGQAIAAAFFSPNASYTSLTSGYSARYPASLGGDPANVAIMDKVGVSGSAPQTMGVTLNVARPFIGFGVTLTR